MTTQQMLDSIAARTGGTGEGVITMDGLMVAIKILDAKHQFGRTDILVTPLAGAGERWVNVERLQERGEGGK